MKRFTENVHFKESKLYRDFQENPLGFVDVGAFGQLHPLVDPIAPITRVTGFEPEKTAYENLLKKYAAGSPYAGISLYPYALAGKEEKERKLYITREPQNVSLLKPCDGFIRRYGGQKFEVEREVFVETITLDESLRRAGSLDQRAAEVIKLDTQGSEHEILSGAERTLQHCLAVWCEVEFLQIYSGQKTYVDIDIFLRKHGLFLYALFPRFRSTKALDPKTHHTEERLFWADALFFRDPLDERNKGKAFSERDMQVLILAAAAAGFYDFSLELTNRIEHTEEKQRLKRWLEDISADDPQKDQEEVTRLYEKCVKNPAQAPFLRKKFISEGRFHGDVTYIPEQNS